MFFNGRNSVRSSSWIQFSGMLVDEDITNVLRHLDVRVQSLVKPSTKKKATLQNSKQVERLLQQWNFKVHTNTTKIKETNVCELLEQFNIFMVFRFVYQHHARTFSTPFTDIKRLFFQEMLGMPRGETWIKIKYIIICDLWRLKIQSLNSSTMVLVVKIFRTTIGWPLFFHTLRGL